MAFTALTTAQVAAGEPTKQELFDLIRTNLDDHETRIATNEANVASINPFQFKFLSPQDDIPAIDGIMYMRVPFDVTWLGARIVLFEDGTSGTLDVEVKTSSDGGSTFNSITTGAIQIAATGGNFSTTSGTIDNGNNTSSGGDFLRIDINGVQTGGGDFTVVVEYEAQ